MLFQSMLYWLGLMTKWVKWIEINLLGFIQTWMLNVYCCIAKVIMLKL